jgi:hypothetical protein
MQNPFERQTSHSEEVRSLPFSQQVIPQRRGDGAPRSDEGGHAHSTGQAGESDGETGGEVSVPRHNGDFVVELSNQDHTDDYSVNGKDAGNDDGQEVPIALTAYGEDSRMGRSDGRASRGQKDGKGSTQAGQKLWI